MTIVTRVAIAAGQEPAWDAAFRERAASAQHQPGFVGVQLCIPAETLDERVVIGTWQTRADWEAWHATDVFQRTRQVMGAAETERLYEAWYEVVLEQRA